MLLLMGGFLLNDDNVVVVVSVSAFAPIPTIVSDRHNSILLPSSKLYPGSSHLWATREEKYLKQHQFEHIMSSGQEIHGVTLKLALDQQGGVADLAEIKSERFTCAESLDMVHRLRRDCDAVVVGRKTVEWDDCTLTVRRVDPKLNEETQLPIQPVRVIVDPNRQLVLDQYKIATDGMETLIYYHDVDLDEECDYSRNNNKNNNNNNDDNDAIYSYERDENYPNVQWVGMTATDPSNNGDDGGNMNHKQLSTKDIIRDLKFHQGLWHIMVEGGPTTVRQFLEERLVDRAIVVHAPIQFQQPSLSGLTRQDFEHAGLELIHEGNLGVDRVAYWSRPGLSWPKCDESTMIWP